jgi:hypothetical protein
MRLNTRIVRSLAFAVMLAALPLARANVAAGESGDCGPYWCDSACAMSGGGGWLLWQGCSSCSGEGCAGGGDGCTRICESCNGGDWNCIPI